MEKNRFDKDCCANERIYWVNDNTYLVEEDIELFGEDNQALIIAREENGFNLHGRGPGYEQDRSEGRFDWLKKFFSKQTLENWKVYWLTLKLHENVVWLVSIIVGVAFISAGFSYRSVTSQNTKAVYKLKESHRVQLARKDIDLLALNRKFNEVQALANELNHFPPLLARCVKDLEILLPQVGVVPPDKLLLIENQQHQIRVLQKAVVAECKTKNRVTPGFEAAIQAQKTGIKKANTTKKVTARNIRNNKNVTKN